MIKYQPVHHHNLVPIIRNKIVQTVMLLLTLSLADVLTFLLYSLDNLNFNSQLNNFTSSGARSGHITPPISSTTSQQSNFLNQLAASTNRQ